MRSSILIAATCLALAAALLPAASRESELRSLVAELTGEAKPKQRPDANWPAAYNDAVRYLLDRMTNRGLSTSYRIRARDDLETVCLRTTRPDAPSNRRAMMCGVLLKLLAEPPEKVPPGVILTMLEYIGGAESVDALAARLFDRDQTMRERALRALQRNDSPEASAKLRQAAFQAVRPEWKVALINAIGYRRDRRAIEWLAKMLREEDERIARAAAAALGKIGGPDAQKALNDMRLLATPVLRTTIADALFAIAHAARAAGDARTAETVYRKFYENPTEPKRNRIAALRCMVAARGEQAVGAILKLIAGGDSAIMPVAMELARELPGSDATRALADQLAKATDLNRKIALIELLGARADRAGRAAVLQAMTNPAGSKEDRQRLRLAGIDALAGVGTAEDVILLARLATQHVKGKEKERELAERALRRLRGPDVHQAMIAGVRSGEPQVRRQLIQTLGARRAAEATDVLLSLAADADTGIRHTALSALGQVGDANAIPPICKWLDAAKDRYERRYAERALTYIAGRAEDDEDVAFLLADNLRGARDPNSRAALMSVCGHLTGPTAMAALASGLSDENETVREAAVEALARARDPAAAQQLLKVARNATSKEERALAVRGYIRLLRRIELPPEKKIWMYIQIMDLAARPEERKYIIQGLGQLRTAASVKMVMEYIDHPELRSTAEQAACHAARYVARENPEAAIEDMQRLLTLTQSDRTRKEAGKIIKQAQQYLKQKREREKQK